MQKSSKNHMKLPHPKILYPKSVDRNLKVDDIKGDLKKSFLFLSNLINFIF